LGGLFIFAVTAIKYIQHLRHLPTSQLDELLSRKSKGNRKLGSSFDNLDKLYTHVLQSALGDDPRHYDEVGQRLRMLLGMLMVLFEPLSVASLAYLLGWDEELLRLELGSLSVVILVPEDGSTDTIHFFHTSFQDYPFDSCQCTNLRFLIGATQEFHELVAVRGSKLQLEHLKNNSQNSLSDSNSKLTPYILHHVPKHRDMPNATVIGIQQACLRHFKAGHPDPPDLVNGLSRSLPFRFYRGGSKFLQTAIH
jgi:hypothetical protein